MTYALSLFDSLVLAAMRLGAALEGDAAEPKPQASPQTCAATLARAQRGQADAQSALVRELQDVWYRYALSILRDPEQARDAAQDTALRFLKGLAQFRGDSRLKTWSLGIATNVCRERLRQTRKHPHALSPDHHVADHAPGPLQHAQLREQRDTLLALLDDLPQRQREAVVLRYLEQLSVREAAEAMGCAEGTVKATLSQAITSLRKRLGVDDG